MISSKFLAMPSVLVKWVNNSGLAVNKRRNYMIFSRQRNLNFRDVVISGATLERKTEARFLAVTIDNR